MSKIYQLDHLYQLSVTLGNTLDLCHEVATFMQWLADVVRPDMAFLFLIDENRQRLRLVKTLGCEVPIRQDVPLGFDLWRWLAEQGVIMPSGERHTRYAVPISFEGRLYGTLCLVSQQCPEKLQKEQQLVNTAAGFLAPVLCNIRLYQTLERQVAERTAALAASEERHRRLAERLRILREMDQAILAARSPEEIAEAAVKHIRKLIPSLGAGIAKFDFSVGTAILLATNVSLRDWLRPGLKVPLAGVEPLIAELRQGAINQVDDLQAMPSPLPEALQLLQAVGVRSYIAIPLMIQDTLMGALCIGAQEPAAFSEEHIEVASEIANSLAIALHQKQLFQEVQRQRRQVRALAAQIDQIEQAERRRLAHELHDQIGQNLTALSIHLSTIRTILSPETAHRALPRLDDAITLVEEIAQRIRDVMAELHPAILDDYGLLPALRWYAENFSQRTGIIAHVRGDDEAPRLPSRVETTLFRIAQEVLTNVAKHAQATRVTITLEMKGEGACLMITDDGVGFDPTTLQKPEQRERWGLRIMRERAEAIGGRLSIHSAPGKGTQVVVEIGTTQT